MRTALLVLPIGAIIIAPSPAAAQWTGGPVIITGTDPDGHNSNPQPPDFTGCCNFDPIFPDSWTGALFIQQGFNYLRRHLDFDRLRGRETVVCLGCGGGPANAEAETVFNAARFDFDNDRDIDGADFGVFASCFNKAGNPPRSENCPTN